MSVLCDPRNGDEAHLAGETQVLIGIDGRVVRIGYDLAWEENQRGWESTGKGAAVFDGAYLANQQRWGAANTAAIAGAWAIAAEMTGVGPLVDELTLPAPGNGRGVSDA